MHWNEIWYGDAFVPRLVRTVLTPPSWAYTLGWNTYLALYSSGLKRPSRPHRPVLCVGNLTVGGTGKTPLTMFLAEELKLLGYDVAISCSGYGSPASEDAALAPTTDLAAAKWGDEASLLRWKLPGVTLIVGRNRVRAAELCQENFPNSVLLMDDGFQHLPLSKDITILIESSSPNRRCLPAGPYREPFSHRKRATLVLHDEFKIESLPMAFVAASNGQVRPTPARANSLCALGSPETFFDALRSFGVQLETAIAKPDHAPLQEADLFKAISPDLPLVVTAKDWVKLRERVDLDGREILVAEHEVEVRPRSEFASWLQERLNEVVEK